MADRPVIDPNTAKHSDSGNGLPQSQIKKLALAVFISGRGSNLQSLIDACADPQFPAEIKLVIYFCDSVHDKHGEKAENIEMYGKHQVIYIKKRLISEIQPFQ